LTYARSIRYQWVTDTFKTWFTLPRCVGGGAVAGSTILSLFLKRLNASFLSGYDETINAGTVIAAILTFPRITLGPLHTIMINTAFSFHFNTSVLCAGTKTRTRSITCLSLLVAVAVF